MRRLKLALLTGSLSMIPLHQAVLGQSPDEATQPPIAKLVPKKLENHGHVRIDNYYWLRERHNPEAIDYLRAENAYTEAVMAGTKEMEDSLFKEIKGRIKQTDMSVPYKKDDYFYYTRLEDGEEYPIHCRKKGSLDGPEEIMIDVNMLARGHGFCSVRGLAVSFDQDILAYALDRVGRRFYTVYFKSLDTGELLEDVIPDITGNIDWANDNRTLFYAKQDPTTLRSHKIYRHVLGTDPSEDQLVYEEADHTFSTYVWKTKSKQYMMIASYHTLSSEYRYLDANDPNGEFKVFEPRQMDHEYDVDHYEDKFYIRTNDQAKNFRLMETDTAQTGKEHWKEIVPHRDDVFLESFEIFEGHLVLEERKNGLIHLRIIPWAGGEEHYVDFGEPAYLAYVSTNPDFKTPLLRFAYTSMTTPTSIYDYNMGTRERVLLKQQEVLGGFDSKNYATERLHAPAGDGTEIPISIVYRRGIKRDGGNPLLLSGYGSYGASMDAAFSSPRLSLIDRGFIYALAHVRGGQELGRRWYEDGRLLKKKNTFTDFIACAEHLIREQFTSPENLFTLGGSAGGLLIGAVINMRPDLFKGAVAHVPFVDVATTMLDPGIPLTTEEYDEWGDPNNKEYFEYMLSYSPYDNVEVKDYPNLLVTTSLHDSEVQYWEPAKWVAKLRATKTDQNRLLLKTYMEAGHGGQSGRYEGYEEAAFYYTFLLNLAGIEE